LLTEALKETFPKYGKVATTREEVQEAIENELGCKIGIIS
jgi:hypothetical protein